MDYETPQFFRVMEYARQADRDVVDMVSGEPDWEPPAPLREGLHDYADASPRTSSIPRASVCGRSARKSLPAAASTSNA